MRKTFKAAARDEELEFETSEGDVFHARPKLSAGVILRFSAAMAGDGDENVSLAEMVVAIQNFFRGALLADDYERFLAMLDDPDKGVSLDELMDIAGWLAGVYSARPTGTDSPAGSPTSPTGDASTDGPSPVVTTFSRKDKGKKKSTDLVSVGSST